MSYLVDVIGDVIPNDHSGQCDAFRMISGNASAFKKSELRLLDLGCGTGGSFERLARFFPNLDYVGADIEASPEVDSRQRDDLTFVTYDGETLPFDMESFDVCFCKQVLEHVRFPDKVIAEVARVLNQVAILWAPYHVWNLITA